MKLFVHLFLIVPLFLLGYVIGFIYQNFAVGIYAGCHAARQLHMQFVGPAQ